MTKIESVIWLYVWSYFCHMHVFSIDLALFSILNSAWEASNLYTAQPEFGLNVAQITSVFFCPVNTVVCNILVNE